ncbi:MAG TPA: aspartate aminotransferase family protein [Pirellulaceae bacterium]|nr:aspartate aminotransferase family protein [Pirellulaceae bacterium]HMO92150.1 aspartate aminotransferase family protein [Pirellulaceae bacterium]HMP68924.1 aspartate aminotransferase family protein [Pirellulaceae bacterium]
MNSSTSNSRPFYITWSAQSSAETLDVVGADGEDFVLSNGRRIFDFLSTSFQTSFGHSQEFIISSIERQLRQMSIATPKADFSLKRDVTEKLIALLGFSNGKLFYTVSGAESVENALKIARQIKGRTKIMARQRSYHGASLGALSVTGDWRNANHFTCSEHTVRIPEPTDDRNCEALSSLFEMHQGSIAALIVETITGANGVIIPPESWFAGVQDLCTRHDVFLILDEVLCGFGRTGKAFGFQHYPMLRPDIVCMAKAISGGYIPFGAIWTSQEIADAYEDRTLSCGLTNYAHPLGLAALQGVLTLLNSEEFDRSFNERIEFFTAEVQRLGQSLAQVTATRQIGMMAAIELDRPAPSWRTAIERGMHLSSTGQQIVIAPPLITPVARILEEFRNLELLISDSRPN